MTYDVAIVGAGPSGLAAAVLLARAGKKVALFDPALTRQDSLPYKVGESLPASINNLLRKLQLGSLLGEPHQRIPGSQSLWSGESIQQDFISQAQGLGWRVDRVAFEKDLLQQALDAGAEHYAAQLQTIDFDGALWQLECDTQAVDEQALQSKFMIDASGRRGALTRTLAIPRTKHAPLVALWCVGEGGEQVNTQEFSRQTFIESQDEGWWYAAYLPNGRPMAIFHTSAAYAAHLRQDQQRWQMQLKKCEFINTKISPDAFEKQTLKVNEARTIYLPQAYGQHWAACGDAALSFDPISSQGIYHAIASADMLCKVLLAKTEDDSATDIRQQGFEHYQQKLNNIFAIYLQRRQQFYQRAYDFHRTDFWEEQLHF